MNFNESDQPQAFCIIKSERHVACAVCTDQRYNFLHLSLETQANGHWNQSGGGAITQSKELRQLLTTSKYLSYLIYIHIFITIKVLD